MSDPIEGTARQDEDIPYEPEKEFLPSSLAALILSIASLLNMAFFGWIPAIIALNKAKAALEAAEGNPGMYTEQSISMAQAAKKMALIGLICGILGMFVTFFYYYWMITSSLNDYRGFHY